MEISSLNIKKINQRKSFLMFPEMESYTSHPNPKKLKKFTRKKLLIFPEMKLSSSNIKEILIFSQKKVFLIFPKTETCTFQAKLEK